MAEPFADIERLVDALQSPSVPATARANAGALVGALLEAHRHAIEMLAGALDATELRSLAVDPSVAAILLLHGLHPDPPAERLAAAIEEVRRELAPAIGVDVELTDSAAVVILQGPGAAETSVRTAFSRAARAALPDIDDIEIQSAVSVELGVRSRR